jgi:EpsI family protein
MITKRLFAVELILVAGLGTVFLLPQAPKTKPAGISLKLPIWVGNWIGDDAAITQREIEVLAKDTQFARKVYTSPDGDAISVSIILSGDDMTTSIHRPERCLPAQGWSLVNTSQRTITLPNSGPLRTTRLSNVREMTAKDNQRFLLPNVTYYWFVGHSETTPSHLTRTMLDLRDRILHGYNQRWAYVTVAATVTQGIARPERTEAETDAMIKDFIGNLVPKLQRPDGGALLEGTTLSKSTP